MLKELKEFPPGITGLKATGKVTKEDHERDFEPKEGRNGIGDSR